MYLGSFVINSMVLFYLYHRRSPIHLLQVMVHFVRSRVDSGNGYFKKDKDKAKTGQNQARDWKEHEKSKPKTCSS
ncbi:hypothetical protein Tco_0356658 [Tanacetum coccineum]